MINARDLSNIYVVVVTCVVLRRFPDGSLRTLIFKREDSEDEGPGLWTIPGGKVDRKDWGRPIITRSYKNWKGVIARAIKREVREETGLILSRVFMLESRDTVFIRKSGVPTLVLTFFALVDSGGRIGLGGNFKDSRWVERRELARFAFIGDVRTDIKKAMYRFELLLSLASSQLAKKSVLSI